MALGGVLHLYASACQDMDALERRQSKEVSASCVMHASSIAQFLAMEAHLKVPLQGLQWLHRQKTRLQRSESAGCCCYAKPPQSNGHRPPKEGDGRL